MVLGNPVSHQVEMLRVDVTAECACSVAPRLSGTFQGRPMTVVSRGDSYDCSPPPYLVVPLDGTEESPDGTSEIVLDDGHGHRMRMVLDHAIEARGIEIVQPADGIAHPGDTVVIHVSPGMSFLPESPMIRLETAPPYTGSGGYAPNLGGGYELTIGASELSFQLGPDVEAGPATVAVESQAVSPLAPWPCWAIACEGATECACEYRRVGGGAEGIYDTPAFGFDRPSAVLQIVRP